MSGPVGAAEHIVDKDDLVLVVFNDDALDSHLEMDYEDRNGSVSDEFDNSDEFDKYDSDDGLWDTSESYNYF